MGMGQQQQQQSQFPPQEQASQTQAPPSQMSPLGQGEVQTSPGVAPPAVESVAVQAPLQEVK